MELFISVIFYSIIIYLLFTLYLLFTQPFMGRFIGSNQSYVDTGMTVMTEKNYTNATSTSYSQLDISSPFSVIFKNTFKTYLGALFQKDIPTIVLTIVYSIIIFYTIHFINKFITNGYLLFIIGFFLLNYLKTFSIKVYNSRVLNKQEIDHKVSIDKQEPGWVESKYILFSDSKLKYDSFSNIKTKTA